MSDLRRIDLLDRKAAPAPPDMTPPQLLWVEIAALRVDDTYQRPIMKRGWRQIEWIAENFNWASFQPVLVSRIEGGLFALIDGQHRAHAALLAGFDTIPALCVEVDQVQQAAAFARVNGNVTQITQQAMFKAALAAGEMWAVESDRAVSEAGCTLMRYMKSGAERKPGEVFQIGMVREMVRNGEAEAVTAGLDALRRSSAGSNPDVWTSQIVKPWLTAIASNVAYLRLDLADALDVIDLVTLYDDASERAKLQRVSRPPLLRRAIIEALDHYRGKRRDAA